MFEVNESELQRFEFRLVKAGRENEITLEKNQKAYAKMEKTVPGNYQATYDWLKMSRMLGCGENP